MTEKVTDGLTVEERRIQSNGTYYVKYKTNFFVDTTFFTKAIESLGGYVYNVCVGKIGNIIIFNGFTWLSVHETKAYEDCDTWAERVEMAIYHAVGPVSPIHIHHPVPGLHSWGIEFNRDRQFWDNPSDQFVKEARMLLDSDWFYQSGSNQPDTGYQFFEFMGTAGDTSFDGDEHVVRSCAIKIAEKIGTIVVF